MSCDKCWHGEKTKVGIKYGMTWCHLIGVKTYRYDIDICREFIDKNLAEALGDVLMNKENPVGTKQYIEPITDYKVECEPWKDEVHKTLTTKLNKEMSKDK